LSLFSQVSLHGHFFSLPPIINDLKVQIVQLVKAKHKATLDTLQATDYTYKEIFTGYEMLKVQIQRLDNRILIEKDRTKRLSEVQKTGEIFKFGDELFYFTRIKNVRLLIPTETYEVKSQTHQCRFERKDFVPPDLYLDIVPNLFNPFSDQDKRWYIRLWAEYDGKITNNESISAIERLLEQLVLERTNLAVELSNKEFVREKIKNELDKLQKQVDKYSSILQIMDKEAFTLDELPIISETMDNFNSEQNMEE